MNDNPVRLPRAFAAAGWEVRRIDHDSLAVQGNRLLAQRLDGDDGALLPLDGFDCYWMLGFGARATFLDRMQLLRSLDQSRFVNGADAFVYLHGKATLLLVCPGVPQPVTHMSNDAAALWRAVRQGGEWIAKPPAGSFGRGVFRLSAADVNARAVLDHLTSDGRHALVQEYIAPDADGEKRALIAAGHVLGAYGKAPADHRANIRAGARARPTTLSARERSVLERLAADLEALGVRFATADFTAHRVLEVNVVNPGWLATYEALHGVDLAPTVVALLAESKRPCVSAVSCRSGSADCG